MTPAIQVAPAKPKPAAPKLTLANITRGRQKKPWRILVYGTEGVGKTTFAAAAPKPLFIGAEDGTDHLDVARVPARSWLEIRAAVDLLLNEQTEFETMVLDTVDAAEPMLWDFICRRDGKSSIEEYGYGKGYQAALDEWRSFLVQIEALRGKGINVLMIGHAQLKLFKNPENEDFDRYELKLNKSAAGLLKEWNDAVLFMNYETFSSKDTKTKRVRGVSTGARLLYTTRTAAFDAKNRFALPDQMNLSFSELQEYMNGKSQGSLLEEIQRKAMQISTESKLKVLDAIVRADGDIQKLHQLNSWVNAQPVVQPSPEVQENNHV